MGHKQMKFLERNLYDNVNANLCCAVIGVWHHGEQWLKCIEL